MANGRPINSLRKLLGRELLATVPGARATSCWCAWHRTPASRPLCRLGHPLGASSARLTTAAGNQLHAAGGRCALCTAGIGVGEGIAVVRERVQRPVPHARGTAHAPPDPMPL